MKHKYHFTLAAILFVLFGFASQTLAQHIPEADNEDYHTALRLYQEGLYENAIEYFNRFTEKFPESSLDENARYHLALAHARLDMDSADTYLEEFISRYPTGYRAVDLMIHWANDRAGNEEYDVALQYYERAFQINKNRDKAALLYYRMAEASVELGDIGGASSYYLKIADNYPQTELAPTALYARGRLYLSEGQYQESTDAFELLREIYPNHIMTRRVGTALGESYFQQRRYEEAISSLQDAIPHLDDESESRAILLIAESYNYLSQLQSAINYYRRYINLNEGKDRVNLAHYGLGWVYHKQEVYHWAAQSFGKAVNGEGETSRKALYYKAVNEKLSGRYDLAMKSFQDFGDQYKNGFWVETAYHEWAVTAFEMGNNTKALEVLLNLIRNGDDLEKPGVILTLLGESYFANNEYTRAMQAFEEAEKLVDVDPTIQRQARFQRAWVQYQNQAYRSAQTTFQEIYEEDTSGPLAGESLFWSADSYYNMDNWSRASSQFERFLNEYPNHEFSGAARYSLGWTYFNTQQYEKAVGPLVRFLEEYEPPPIALFPYDIDTKLRLADAHYALGNYDEAIPYYEEATGADPGGDYALFQIGNSYHRDEQSFEAVSTFRRLIRIYPDSRLREQGQYNIGYIYFLTGNYSQAIEEFNALIRRTPNSTWAARSQYNIGDAHYNAGLFDEAVEAYKKVLQNHPQSDYIIESINGIQFSQLAAGEEDSSAEIMEDFLNSHPQSGTADRLRYRLAENHLQAGNYEAAVSSLRNYIRITNSDRLVAEAHYHIGMAFERLDDPDSAIREYQLIVSEHSGSDRADEALLNLAMLYYDKEEFGLSISAYEALISKSSALAMEARVGAGKAYLASGETDKAQEKFSEGINEVAGHEDSRLGLGKVAIAKRNYNEAEQIFSDIANSSSARAGAEAQYHLGLVYQNRSDYDNALRAYSNVRVLFEGYDEWVSRSLLRSAECHRSLGADSEAENALRQLIEGYPDSGLASEAASILNSSR
ncbi:MAG: tetratricopeptide repeat protein [Balneolales bacterium]